VLMGVLEDFFEPPVSMQCVLWWFHPRRDLEALWP